MAGYLRELRSSGHWPGAEEPELTAAGAACAPETTSTPPPSPAPAAPGGSACWGSRWSTAETWPSALPHHDPDERAAALHHGAAGGDAGACAARRDSLWRWTGRDFLLTVRLALTARQMLSDAAALLDRVVPVT